ncbi:MAG: extracellular solute-binding protein [Erysipelotrichaceae bacterium]|nr:extracellular solute-binding protein [Erysipelotrichaceae bacterium]
MKKFITLLLSALLVFSLAGCGSKPADGNTPSGGENTLEGTYDITVWVSETEGVKELTQKQIEAFMEANPGIVINATIEGISEADSATQMITDVESGADLFCFSQDQLARLVQAGALAVLGDATSATVKERNDDVSVGAATVDGKLYCYPMTSDNGYFMYYDKRIISDDIVDSLEDLVKACEDSNTQFSMEYKTSAWYNAAFFFATGCVSEWQTNADGSFASVNDTFDSPEGLIAMKGMQILAKSPAANSSSDGAAFANAVPSAVVVTGTWASSTVKGILGDNMGVADLPSFTVDGKSYHLGSFFGNKLMGVKPQTDAKKAAVLQQLALYLTDEQAQLDRYELVGWGPSNLKAQANEKVQKDVVLSALRAQNEYSTMQGQIHGSWWDIAKVLGTAAEEATSDADLQAALDSYKSAIDGLFSINGYVFVGAWNGWNNADQEAALMTQEGENLTITLDVPESDYMGGRIVAAGDWGTDMGCQQVTEGADLIQPYDAESNGDNNIIFLEAGNYTVSANLSSKEIKIVKN